MSHNRRILYTARAHVTGGRVGGHGRTSDGALEVDLQTPIEMGAGRRRRRDVADVAIDSRVMLVPTRKRGFAVAVELHISLPSVHDPQEAAELVLAAHQICPYSNATRGNIDVALIANGRPVDDTGEPVAA